MKSLPRSSTELFPETMCLSPKQREVLNALQKFPQGTRAVEVAEALNMHVNTARGHLDELISVGAVRAVTAPAQGRGRPSLIFQVRVPDNRSIAEEYISLINLMAQILGESNASPESSSTNAHDIGTRWARSATMPADATASNAQAPHMPPTRAQQSPRRAMRATNTADASLSLLFRTMRDMGFDPVMNHISSRATEIELHACPFVAAGVKPCSFVCEVHEGFLAESTRTCSDGELHLRLVPNSGNSLCKVRVTRHERCN